MEWDDTDLAQAAALAARISAEPGPRRTLPGRHPLTLRLSDAAALAEGLPIPRNPGALLVRQLFHALRFDEKRVTRWRLEHKLVQALVLQHYCPGVVPVTRGLWRSLAGCTRERALHEFDAILRDAVIVKPAVGEASGEMHQSDQRRRALRQLDAIQHQVPCPDALADETFVVQERLRIRDEYRVHSFEDRVIPALTYPRYSHTRLTRREARTPAAFVQTVLDRLPPGLVRETMYGWDVVIDDGGTWRVLEANPAGYHEVYKPGFHCSGFFQVPRTGPSALARLLRPATRFGSSAASTEVEVDVEEPADRAAYYRRVVSYATRLRERRAHRRQVAAWNKTAADYPANRGVHHLFEAQARRSPDAVAVVADDGSLTYAALDERANRLARGLRDAGAGPETCVGLCLTRGLGLVAAMLGILKTGAAYVPLDPTYPRERLAYMIEHARVSIILTEEALRAVMPPAASAKLLLLEGPWPSDSATSDSTPSDSAPSVSVHPDQLAYLMYTSGSTGHPKGVAVRHAGLTNVVCDLRQRLGVRAGDRWLAITTVSFDPVGVDIYVPLLAGAQIWLAAAEDAADGVRLRQRLARSDATFLQATPVTWGELVNAGWTASPGFVALCGGDTLPRTLASELLRRGARVWNLYGPTETSIWSSASIVDEHDTPITVGTPLANTTLHVLDRKLRPRPLNTPGELFIGGAGLARGYAGLPGTTAERFVPDPFAAQPGARMYRTGDRACWTPAGVRLLGRTDLQVKLRGVRIELGEIEHALRQHADLRDAAVVVRRDPAGRARLIAYVVIRSSSGSGAGANCDRHPPRDLQEFLRARLPQVMVPQTYVVLQELPRTLNLKLDRKALARLESVERPESMNGIEPPALPTLDLARTDTEHAVARIWTTVLQLSEIGMEDDFLGLGGDSIHAIQCVHRIRETFDVDLPMIALFVEGPTVRTLAALVDEHRRRTASAGATLPP